MSVFDEDEHGSVGVAATDSDVVEAAAVAEGDLAELVHGVVADSVVGVVEGLGGWGDFGSGGVGLDRGASVQRPVGAGRVVVVNEGVELALEPGDGGDSGLVGEPLS